MNILKKILAFAIILGLFGQTTINTFANELNTDLVFVGDNINISKQNIIKNIKGGDKIIMKIDSFVSKIDEKKIKILVEKLKKIRQTKNIKKGGKIDLILIYLELRVLSVNQYYLDIKKYPEIFLLTEFNKNLSTSDNKKVNSELIKIQNNILNYGVDNFKIILGKLEEISNFEEKGNFKAILNIDHELVGKIKAELNLEDYVSRNSGFDAEFKTKINALIDASVKGKEIKLKTSAFIDYILKDQNYYLLLEKFKITDKKGVENMELFFEKAKELASKNKYIHIEDKNSQYIMQKIKQFTPQNILLEGKKIASKPLFRAYKKEGNKYFLIPSKYGCDTAKKLAQKFDPYNGDSCTEGQYKDILKYIADSKVEFYIDFSGKNTKIGFDAKEIEKDIEEYNGEIIFSDKYIEEINFIVRSDQIKFPKQEAILKYKRNNNLDISFYAKKQYGNKEEVFLKLESTLDRSNNFSFIDFSAKSEEFSAELKLNNRKITGKYNFEKRSRKVVGIISGKTTYKNELSELKISHQSINVGKYFPFDNIAIIDYKNGKINFNNKFTSEGNKSEFNIGGKINNNTLSEGNIKLIVETKDSTYDYNSYKRIYSGNFNKVVDLNINLKNKNISGKTTIFKNTKEFLNIIHTGKSEKDLFELNNKITLGEETVNLSNIMSGKSTKEIIGNVNIKIDTRGNKNSGNIYIDAKLDDKKVLELELDNKSIKTYKKINIEKPAKKDTMSIEEAVGNTQLY